MSAPSPELTTAASTANKHEEERFEPMTDEKADYHSAMASPRRRQVLKALVSSSEPLDATTIAGQLGLHVTTVRFHLDQLTTAGLARRRAGSEKRRGRPRMLYVPATTVRDEDARLQLIDVLASAIARDDDSAAAALQAGRAWAEHFGATDPDDPLPGLVEVLDRLGFGPDPDPAKDSVEIRLRTCPFRSAAREHPDVICAVHRGLIDRLLEDTVTQARLLPFVEPHLCLILLQEAST